MCVCLSGGRCFNSYLAKQSRLDNDKSHMCPVRSLALQARTLLGQGCCPTPFVYHVGLFVCFAKSHCAYGFCCQASMPRNANEPLEVDVQIDAVDRFLDVFGTAPRAHQVAATR